MDLMLPRRCCVCGRRLGLHEEFLCIYCYADMPFSYNWDAKYNKMSDRLNETIGSDTGHHEPYAYAVPLFLYDSHAGYRNIALRLKYQSDAEIGKYFGRLLGEKLAGSSLFSDVDMIVPVPLHWRRRLARGYNQAEIIAREVGKKLNAGIAADILVRKRNTVTQTRLDIQSKHKNMEGAFIFNRRRTDIGKYRHILIVDDVFTSGATTGACYNILRKKFSPAQTRISIGTLAFTGD